MFSVLNDVPLNNTSINNLSRLRNAGIRYKNSFVELGYGNWNRWWGPGMHNSLLISNNSLGFYHFFIRTNDFFSINNYIKYHFEYVVSNGFQNKLMTDFFNTFLTMNLKVKI